MQTLSIPGQDFEYIKFNEGHLLLIHKVLFPYTRYWGLLFNSDQSVELKISSPITRNVSRFSFDVEDKGIICTSIGEEYMLPHHKSLILGNRFEYRYSVIRNQKSIINPNNTYHILFFGENPK